MIAIAYHFGDFIIVRLVFLLINEYGDIIAKKAVVFNEA